MSNRLMSVFNWNGTMYPIGYVVMLTAITAARLEDIASGAIATDDECVKLDKLPELNKKW